MKMITPKNLNQLIGFGKYKNISVIDVYTGTSNIPQALYELCLKTFIDIESLANDFTCFDAMQLEIILANESDKILGQKCVRKSLEDRFSKQVEKDTERVDASLPPYYRAKSNFGCSKTSRVEALKNTLSFDDSYDLFYDDYFQTLSLPFTSEEGEFIKSNFIKSYIIFSQTNKEEYWLDEKHFDYLGFITSVVEKYWNEELWSERWDPPYAASPLIVNLKETMPPIYSGGSQYVLLYGKPEYLEWALKTTNFFVIPRNIEYLEGLEVNCPPDIQLSKITNDIIEWSISNKKYKFLFSGEAKFANKCKYEAYVKKQDELNSPEPDYDDYLNPRRYTRQNYIDDAFGGEASAYWNID